MIANFMVGVRGPYRQQAVRPICIWLPLAGWPVAASLASAQTARERRVPARHEPGSASQLRVGTPFSNWSRRVISASQIYLPASSR